MPTSLGALLSWIADVDLTCPPALLRAAWRTASAGADPAMMAVLARHPAIPADLDALIAQVAIPTVRIAHLSRPGLLPERAAQLLANETRTVVLTALLGPDTPRAVRTEILNGFGHQPTVGLAKALLDANPADLDLGTVQAISLTLLPRRRQLTPEQQQRLHHLIMSVKDLTVRANLTPALLSLVTNQHSFGRPSLTIALLHCAADEPTQELVGLTICQEMTRALPRPQARAMWEPAVLALRQQPTLPPLVRTRLRALCRHRQAVGGAFAELVPTDSSGANADLRITSEPNALKAALAGPLSTEELLALLHNQWLSAELAQRAAELFARSGQPYELVRNVPAEVRTALLRSSAAQALTVHGWEWFCDPAAEQRAFLAHVVVQANCAAASGPEVWGEVFVALTAAHRAAPLLDEVWRDVPVPALRVAGSSGGSALAGRRRDREIAALIGALLERSLGSNTVAWDVVAGRLDTFTGTFGELLDLAAAPFR